MIMIGVSMNVEVCRRAWRWNRNNKMLIMSIAIIIARKNYTLITKYNSSIAIFTVLDYTFICFITNILERLKTLFTMIYIEVSLINNNYLTHILG